MSWQWFVILQLVILCVGVRIGRGTKPRLPVPVVLIALLAVVLLSGVIH